VMQTHRLTRSQFERWFANREVGLVIMEACGSAHYWARWLNALGIEVKLLPAAYADKGSRCGQRVKSYSPTFT
jgi:transposase